MVAQNLGGTHARELSYALAETHSTGKRLAYAHAASRSDTNTYNRVNSGRTKNALAAHSKKWQHFHCPYAVSQKKNAPGGAQQVCLQLFVLRRRRVVHGAVQVGGIAKVAVGQNLNNARR